MTIQPVPGTTTNAPLLFHSHQTTVLCRCGTNVQCADILLFGLLNVQSINNKSVTICDLIEDDNFDIMALTETWHAQSSDLPLRNAAPPGYSIIDAPRPHMSDYTGANHGGIAIVHRSTIASRLIALPFYVTTFETLICSLRTPLTNLMFVVVYRPASQPITNKFFDDLTSLLEVTAMYKSKTVICGDFNVHIDDSNDSNALQLLDLLEAFGLTQHINGSTHMFGHTLDLVITAPDFVPLHTCADSPIFSDHGLVTCFLPHSRPVSSCLQTKVIRKIKAIDNQIVTQTVMNLPICADIPRLVGQPASALCELYSTSLRQVLDDLAPATTISVRDSSLSPWYDGECRAARRLARSFERRYRRSRMEADRLAWIRQLETKRVLITQKAASYWTNSLHACHGNSKQLWCCLNTILRRDVPSSVQSVIVTAESLEAFFCDKVEAVRSATRLCPPPAFTVFDGSHFDDFRPCSIEEIRQTIQKSPPKSCTLDPIPNSLFTPLLEQLLPILHLLCNTSMSDGVLPDSEKAAIVTPILKKAGLDPDNTASYRPISNLTFVSKLIERLVSCQLTSYLQDNHLMPPVQSAYRKHYSTETATLKVASDVFDSIDAGKLTILAMLDLSAAFDTVDHEILKSRLSMSYGVGGTVLRWLTSFLTDRTQTVNFAAQRSAPFKLTCGVPQGSVLGPILFNMYTADVIRIAASFGVTVHCYADDVQLYVHCLAKDSQTAVARLLACIEAIDNWMRSNRLKMNPDKTQCIWLGTRQQLAKISIEQLHLHDGTVITPSTSVRNLGVIFDNELTMTSHVANITCSCFYQLRQLRSVRRSLTDDAAKTLVHAFITSRIDYCNAILYGTSAIVLRRLQAVLNAAARLITGHRKFDHITPALRDELHWLPIQQRIAYKIALTVYNCLHMHCPAYFSEYCIPLSAIHNRYELRAVHHGDLAQPRSRTRKFGPRSFRSSGPAVWNSLPPDIKDISLTPTQFKNKLKTFLFCTAYNIDY